MRIFDQDKDGCLNPDEQILSPGLHRFIVRTGLAQEFAECLFDELGLRGLDDLGLAVVRFGRGLLGFLHGIDGHIYPGCGTAR